MQDEGLVSWTTDLRFAKSFKGLHRPDATTAVIFEHMPKDNEVFINFSSLWKDPNFVSAANDFKTCQSENSKLFLISGILNLRLF